MEKFPNRNTLKLNNYILNINKNIDYLSGLEEIIQNNYEKIIYKINNLKNNYDYILINLSSISNLKLTKKILEISDYNFCIFNKEENDILFNNNLLNIYTEEWGINKNKFICIFNNDGNIDKNDLVVCVDFNNCIIKNELKDKFKYFTKEYLENDIIFNLNLDKYKLNKKLNKKYYKLLKGLKNN